MNVDCRINWLPFLMLNSLIKQEKLQKEIAITPQIKPAQLNAALSWADSHINLKE